MVFHSTHSILIFALFLISSQLDAANMSLGSFFKSMVSPEAMGDEIIATQERLYGQLAANIPKENRTSCSPKSGLAVWLHMATTYETNYFSSGPSLTPFSVLASFFEVFPLRKARSAPA
jgi:hypothetical protein